MAGPVYCGECGTKMKSADAKACPKCGSDPAKTTNFCSSCGTAKASPNAIMCTSCGSSLARLHADKDPGIAALIAALGMLVLAGAAGLGYIYLGNVKKGLAYIIIGWLLEGAIAVGYVIGAYATLGIGAVCCLPLFVIPLGLNIVIIYDVYLEAKGEPTKLPDF